MDNPTFPPPRPAPAVDARFVPDRRFTVAGAAGALIALGIALATDDKLGRLLVIVAVVLLACYSIGDLVFSPRLEASADGVLIRSPFTRARLGWDEIESIKVVSRLHLGLRNVALEIDAGATLAEFTRRSLGADPYLACEQILALRPA